MCDYTKTKSHELALYWNEYMENHNDLSQIGYDKYFVDLCQEIDARKLSTIDLVLLNLGRETMKGQQFITKCGGKNAN